MTKPEYQFILIGKQSGAALLILLALIAIATGAFLVNTFGATDHLESRERATGAALATAKSALIGRSVSDNNRPGSLPCPDTNDDGSAELFAGNACPSYIGRLPSRTLGVPDLRDGNGERLWYVLDENFRDHPNAQPFNTDKTGSIVVHAGSTASQLTILGTAAVFAPGTPLSNQARSQTQTAPCAAMPGPDIAQHLCANNYLDLESVSNINNASAAGTYIDAQRTQGFNDRVVAITSVELMTAVEARAAGEILNALIAYRDRSPCTCFPFADSIASLDGISDWGQNEGLVPLRGAGSVSGTNSTVDWSGTTPPAVIIPAWLTDNDWHRVIWYTLAGDHNFHQAGGTLTVDTLSGIQVVLVATGAASAVRPNFPADYIDDNENRDSDSIFTTPMSLAKNRDRLHVIP